MPYSLLKTVLQGAGVVKGSKRLAKHRIKRERRPLAGMMVYQEPAPPLGGQKQGGAQAGRVKATSAAIAIRSIDSWIVLSTADKDKALP